MLTDNDDMKQEISNKFGADDSKDFRKVSTDLDEPDREDLEEEKDELDREELEKEEIDPYDMDDLEEREDM